MSYIVSPHISFPKRALQTLFDFHFLNHVLAVCEVLLFQGLFIKVASVVNEFIWPEVLCFRQAVHLLGLLKHDSLTDLSLLRLLPLHFTHLPLEAIL